MVKNKSSTLFANVKPGRELGYAHSPNAQSFRASPEGIKPARKSNFRLHDVELVVGQVRRALPVAALITAVRSNDFPPQKSVPALQLQASALHCQVVSVVAIC